MKFVRAMLLCALSCSLTIPVQADTKDPFEGFNRVMFRLNDKMDRILVRPVAKGFQRLPLFVRRRVTNFVDNLDDVNVLVNDMLQGKPLAAAKDAGRLTINSTIGIGGLFDPASRMGLLKGEEDWGQTFGRWGIGPGPYLVLPFIGPSNLRDAIARPIDGLCDPIFYLEDATGRTGLFVLDNVELRASVLAADALTIGDKYLFQRDAYMQRRAYLVRDGKTNNFFDEFDDFDDDFEDDDF